METTQEDKPKKKEPYKVLLPVLYTLLALVGAFNICILSYIGCEIVPWLLTRDSTVAEAQVSTPPAATQPPATQSPSTPPPSAAPVAETETPSDTPDDATEPPASEPPVETPAPTAPPATETATPKPTTAPVTETKTPEPSKVPSATQSEPQTREEFLESLKQYTYVGSAKSTKYHYPTCRWKSEIYPENLIHFASESEAAAAGYEPCKTCKP